jgi:hypothetical protein
MSKKMKRKEIERQLSVHHEWLKAIASGNYRSRIEFLEEQVGIHAQWLKALFDSKHYVSVEWRNYIEERIEELENASRPKAYVVTNVADAQRNLAQAQREMSDEIAAEEPKPELSREELQNLLGAANEVIALQRIEIKRLNDQLDEAAGLAW